MGCGLDWQLGVTKFLMINSPVTKCIAAPGKQQQQPANVHPATYLPRGWVISECVTCLRMWVGCHKLLLLLLCEFIHEVVVDGDVCGKLVGGCSYWDPLGMVFADTLAGCSTQLQLLGREVGLQTRGGWSWSARMPEGRGDGATVMVACEGVPACGWWLKFAEPWATLSCCCCPMSQPKLLGHCQQSCFCCFCCCKPPARAQAPSR